MYDKYPKTLFEYHRLMYDKYPKTFEVFIDIVLQSSIHVNFRERSYYTPINMINL